MYESRFRADDLDELFKAILSLKTSEDCYRFFGDLCTISEIKAMAQRFAVAKMLSRGMTYHDVARLTGASTATISRVNRCLHFGEDGYLTAFERLNKTGAEALR